jgi:cyclopropane-fatty-acyl-phospholipid synthase
MTAAERTVPHLSAPARDRTLSGLPAGFRVAALLLSRLKKGQLDIRFPDGRTLRFAGEEPGPRAEILVRNPAFVNRVLARGDIGFAEAFMDEQFDTPDLATTLEYFTVNFDNAGKLAVGGRLTHLISKVRHAFKANTKKGSKRNILAHYDLGNDFYERWLDPSMTYSSALFDPANLTLEQAQANKYREIARLAGVGPGKATLEIGSGWGGFAEIAAGEFGASVDSVTISDAQYAYATERLARAGLSERAHIQLKDYRDIVGRYDAVVSIEMFEAVGEKYWPSYFSTIARALKPGGRAALQIITIEDHEFDRYRSRPDFIQRYIFPGGMLASEKRLAEEARTAGMTFSTARLFGHDYARTLAAWQAAFEAAWPDIRGGQFDERFRRMWLYYLAYCQAGFRTGRINVGHFVFTRP